MSVAVYGPIADKAATKYGLDTGIFRRLIASESSWNPVAINPQAVNGEHASGIAQFLPSTAQGMGVDPFDPYSALDGAAKYLSDLSGKYGIDVAIAKYKGYSNPSSDAAKATSSKIVGDSATTNPSGKDPLGNQMGPDSVQANKPATSTDNKAFYQYSWTDFKSAISGSALGFALGLVGLLLIIFSVYMLTKQGGTDSVAAVKNLSGA